MIRYDPGYVRTVRGGRDRAEEINRNVQAVRLRRAGERRFRCELERKGSVLSLTVWANSLLVMYVVNSNYGRTIVKQSCMIWESPKAVPLPVRRPRYWSRLITTVGTKTTAPLL